LCDAQNGGQLTDGTTLTISDNAATPSTWFSSSTITNNTAGNVPITFARPATAVDHQRDHRLHRRRAELRRAGGPIAGHESAHLVGESVRRATTNATGIAIQGQPGVAGAAWPSGGGELHRRSSRGDCDHGQRPAGLVFQAGRRQPVKFRGRPDGGLYGMRNPFVFTPDGRGHEQRLPPAGAVLGQRQQPGNRGPRLPGDRKRDGQRLATRTTVLLDPTRRLRLSLSSSAPVTGRRADRAPAFRIARCRAAAPRPAAASRDGFVGDQMYAVTDTGGLFRIASSFDARISGRCTTSRTTSTVRKPRCKPSTTSRRRGRFLLTELVFSDANPDTISS